MIGFKLLVVQIECAGTDLTPERIVAVDMLGAGVGENVLVTRDEPARAGLPPGTPVDAVVVGIVDTVDIQE